MSATVHAQTGAPAPPPPPGPAPQGTTEEAKRHFEQGAALYNDGNYSGALAEFEAALRTHPSPGVLYNLGLTFKALFRYTEAIDHLERYLREDPRLLPERRVEVNQLVREMRALLADITVYVVPDGAAVLLDGRTLGTSPLGPLQIAAGNHVLEATAEGFKPGRREFLVTAQVPMALELKLAAIPRTGRVHIVASQPAARVRVDAREVGTTPVELELGLGGHQLEVAAPGFQTHRTELVIAAGQTRQLMVTLEPPGRSGRFYEKWWFWTTVGVVLIGATAAGVAAGSSSQDALRGTLDPPGAQRVN